MIQPLESEPWPPAPSAEEELATSTERTVLINHLHTADSFWSRVHNEPTARLGEKATAAVMLQDARIRLAAYDDFHPE